MAATSSASATTCDPMKFQAHDFLDPLIITPEVIRSALEPAIESLDLYMAGKYAGAVISGPVAMACSVICGLLSLWRRNRGPFCTMRIIGPGVASPCSTV